MKKTWLQKLQEWFIKLITPIKWTPKKTLNEEQLSEIRAHLTSDYFIIATRRTNFLTSFFINLGHFLLTGRWGFYTHVLMNLEDEVNSDDDFRLIEATTHGTKFSTFEQVFNGLNAASLIKPHSMTAEEWTACMDAAKVHLGKPYDNLFNVKNDLEINCVELVRLALMALPDYSTRFANFEKLLAKKRILTPSMFAECQDFHVYKIFIR